MKVRLLFLRFKQNEVVSRSCDTLSVSITSIVMGCRATKTCANKSKCTREVNVVPQLLQSKCKQSKLFKYFYFFSTVHLGGGLWGVLSVPIFNKESGIFVKGNKLAFRAFGWNLLGVLVIIAWSAAWAIILFFALHLLKQLRVSEEIELKGKYFHCIKLKKKIE